MIEHGKISALQMSLILHTTVIGTAVITLPSSMAKLAGRDMWISPVWASTGGFLAVYLAWVLHKWYPHKTLIEYSERIIGKIPGKIIGSIFLLAHLHLTGAILRQYGEFIVNSFLPQTPMIVITLSMIGLCGVAVHGGLEIIGRSSDVMTPVLAFVFVLVVILLIPDLKTNNLFPVIENGLLPSVEGAVPAFGWFSEYILLSFMLPFITDRNKVIKYGMISVASVIFIMVSTNICTLMIFGNITESFSYPVLVAVRSISIAEFIQHIEALVVAFWVTGLFIKITVFYYVCTLGTAQLLGLSNYRPLVLPLGFLALVFSYWVVPSVAEFNHYLAATASLYTATPSLAAPILLFVIAYCKRRLVPQKGKSS